MPSPPPPPNWPPDLIYLREPVFSPAIDKPTLSLLLLPSSSTTTKPTPAPPRSPTKIKQITTPTSHPAHGQFGLFAARDLAAGALVVEYVGYYHLPTPADSDPLSDYDLCLRHEHPELWLGVDARRMGNEARMVNDYRGVRERPNARFDSFVCERGGGGVRMGVFVIGGGKGKDGKGGKETKGIRKGEEICVSYGKGFWKEREGDVSGG